MKISDRGNFYQVLLFVCSFKFLFVFFVQIVNVIVFESQWSFLVKLMVNVFFDVNFLVLVHVAHLHVVGAKHSFTKEVFNDDWQYALTPL